MKRISINFLLLLFISVNSDMAAFSQQTNVATPFGSVSDSFHENLGVNFGFSIPGGQGPGSRVVGYNGFGITPNIHFTQGGFGSTIPAFGGYSPNSGGRFGWSGGFGSGGRFSLGFEFSQGNTRTLTSTTPSVTLMNGGIGSINSGTLSPFVTGIVPVIGDADRPIDNGVTRGISSGMLRPYSARRSDDSNDVSDISPKSRNGSSISRSSAATSDISVAEIEAQKAAAKIAREQNFQRSLEAARQAHSEKDYRIARIELRKAAKLTDDQAQLRKIKSWMIKLRGR